MKNTVFTGAATALVTPLNEKGIDYERYAALIEWQIAQGIDALVTVGTTGEGSTLTDAEHREAKEAGIVARLSSKMGSAMNTLLDATTSHLAEMMIEGSTMGITEHTRISHELERSDDPNREAVDRLAKDVVSFEQKQIERLKQYL